MTDSPTPPATRAPAWYRPMLARGAGEAHRAATPLELLFDLCFVVAVALAASQLHHAVAEAHFGEAILGYAMAFFAIWWAWMNFTWFASADDSDDVPYRLATLVQIAGALVLAAGVPRAFDLSSSAVVVLGYVVMRLALVAQWLRAARADAAGRPAALRYAAGVTACQVGWVCLLAVPPGWYVPGWLVLIAAELLVPVWAESAALTPWNPRHIAERYGLFTLIVLGECVLASTLAIQTAVDGDIALADLATTAAGGLLTVFGMWWLYFAKEAHEFLTSLRAGIVWGYGHYLVFASAAAVGAGLAVNVDYLTHHAAIGARASAAAFTIPVALFLLAVWALQVRPHHLGRWHGALTPATAVLVLASTFTPEPVLVTGILVAAMIAVSLVTLHRPAASLAR
jgi:low temperature requirement protein LtrA